MNLPLYANAFVLTEAGEIIRGAVEMPALGRETALVRVFAAGVCGTDLAEYRRRIATPTAWPDLPLGHEMAGTVVASGSEDWPDGTPVVVDPAISCGACSLCRSGRTSYCPRLLLLGHNYGSGALADYVTVPVRALIRLPDGIDFVTGALIEPFSCAHRAVDRAGAIDSDVALVLGAGGIGLGIALILEALGRQAPIMVDPSAERRSRAADLGVQTHAEVPAGRAASLVFEASGSPLAFQAAVGAVAHGGRIVVAAQHPVPLPIDPGTAFGKELQLIWSLGALRRDFGAVLGLVESGRLKPAAAARVVDAREFDTAFVASLAAGAHTKTVICMNRGSSA